MLVSWVLQRVTIMLQWSSEAIQNNLSNAIAQWYGGKYICAKLSFPPLCPHKNVVGFIKPCCIRSGSKTKKIQLQHSSLYPSRGQRHILRFAYMYLSFLIAQFHESFKKSICFLIHGRRGDWYISHLQLLLNLNFFEERKEGIWRWPPGNLPPYFPIRNFLIKSPQLSKSISLIKTYRALKINWKQTQVGLGAF